MMHTNIGLGDEARRTSIEVLTQYLADSYVLFIKTQGFHWNVVSRDFTELHQAFQKQYEEIAESIDVTAERIRLLGALAPASLTWFAEQSQLEAAHHDLADTDMVKWLLDDHERLARSLRDAIKITQGNGDEGTADHLIGRLRVHEKTAWQLRSSIVE